MTVSPAWSMSKSAVSVRSAESRMRIGGRVDQVDARTQNGDGRPRPFQGSCVSGRIDTLGHARNNADARPSEIPGDGSGHAQAVVGSLPGTHHGHAGPSKETLFLVSDSKYSFISSSLVRKIALYGGDYSKFVPEKTYKKLKEKFE